MIDFLNLIFDFIRIDLFNGFSLYSILFGIVYILPKIRTRLTQFDEFACNFISFVGICYFLLALSSLAINSYYHDPFCNRLIGPYWFVYWSSPFLYLLMTQLLRVPIVRKSIIFRVILILFLTFTFEQYVIIITSLQRDYAPTSWSYFTSNIGIAWYEFIGHALLKIAFFVSYVFVFLFIRKRIKLMINKNRECNKANPIH